MTDQQDLPKTLLEAVRYFSDLQTCFQRMLPVKWPDSKPTCPKCGSDNVGIVRSRSLLQCKGCRKQFSVKVGTIFEDSPLGLDKWFVAVWYIANDKNGISSHELGRALGVTQKTAWFMLHRIRLAMTTPAFRKLNGEVESDETFIGGKADKMHKHKRSKKISRRQAVDLSRSHRQRRRGIHGSAMTKKPEGLDKFESLIGKLTQVPKKKLDQQVEKAKKKAVKRKK